MWEISAVVLTFLAVTLSVAAIIGTVYTSRLDRRLQLIEKDIKALDMHLKLVSDALPRKRIEELIKHTIDIKREYRADMASLQAHIGTLIEYLISNHKNGA